MKVCIDVRVNARLVVCGCTCGCVCGALQSLMR